MDLTDSQNVIYEVFNIRSQKIVEKILWKSKKNYNFATD